MDTKINTKEVEISNDDRTKLAKIGYYWNELEVGENNRDSQLAKIISIRLRSGL